MSVRPTADIVAALERTVLLRLPIGVGPVAREAAARLAELDAQVSTFTRIIASLEAERVVLP